MSIEVHVRLRPFTGNNVWSSAETVLYSTANPNTRYVYNKVYPSNTTNESIFRGMEAMVHAAFDGKNVTVMAYGQTGSGKTHSMTGLAGDTGVVPRAAKLLLDLKHSNPGTAIQAYYTEIYNESVKDLLEPQRGELTLHDAPDGGVMFEKKMIEVQSFEDFIQLQATAERNRKYGVTNLNEHSSRSHIILTFEIQRHRRSGRSLLNLVDLAGSESASRANTEGLSLREGGFINRSLLTLGNVVDAIVDRRPYIPYRDAKLTRLLRSCLGGSGITLILCCINPSRDNFDQTVATLRFTQRAMKIKNDPVVVLQMPPLFTHQYSAAAHQLIEGLQEATAAEYQRGIRDSFLYCTTTVGSIVTSYASQVADCLHAMGNAQRLLVAHDHAMSIDCIGSQYNQLNELTRQRLKNQELNEGERKRQRCVATEIANRKEKLSKLEAELGSKVAASDTDLAGWEYQLYDAQQKQRSEYEVLAQAELARRARIQYEWALSLERVVSRCIPAIQSTMPSVEEALSTAPVAAVRYIPRPERFGSHALYIKELLAVLARQQKETGDLKAAYEMVQDDVDTARRQQQVQKATPEPSSHRAASASTSPQPRPVAANLSEEEAIRCYSTMPNEDVDNAIHRLEREETALMAQARRRAQRESLRRVRDSQRISRSGSTRSPQSIQLTRGVASDAPPSRASAPSNLHRGSLKAGPQSASNTTAAASSYDKDVFSTLSLLSSLKAQLRSNGGTASSMEWGSSSSSSAALRVVPLHQRTRSRSGDSRSGAGPHASERQSPSGRGNDTAIYVDPTDGSGREEVGRHPTGRAAPPRRRGPSKCRTAVEDAADDSENMTLAESYYAARAGKENAVAGRYPPPQRRNSHTASSKYQAVAEDNAAFDVEDLQQYQNSDTSNFTTTMSTNATTTVAPIGIAARRRMERSSSRPAVERALYALSSNSHSPAPSVERRS